jgi:hypothetical protein
MRFLPHAIGGAALVAVLLWAVGCKPPAATTTETGGSHAKDKKDHDHPDKGPHGGPYAEWGEEEYHVEFTRDPAKKLATIYILDDKIKNAKPIAVDTITLIIKAGKAPVEITLKAAPQEGDPPGKASRFTGTHDSLAAEGALEGEIRGTVGKKAYDGDFKEKGTK